MAGLSVCKIRGERISSTARARSLTLACLRSGGPPRGTQIDSKHFREVSLVEEPFFEDCHLAYGCVAASGKEATKIASYNPAEQFVRSYYPIQMSATIPPAAAAPAPTPAAAADPVGQANVLPNAGNPAAQGSVRTGELMSQTEQLKTHLEEQAAAKRALEERLAAFERTEQERNAKKEAKRKAAEAEAAARAEQDRLRQMQEEAEYRVMQMPKFNAFVEALTASGAPLPDDLKEGYLKIFTGVNASSRTAAAQLEAQTKSMQQQQARLVALEASAKKAEEAQIKAEADARAMQDVMARSSHVLNHSRQHFAAALATPQTPSAADKEDASRQRTAAELNASARDEYGGLMYIMMPAAGPDEQVELANYGFKSEAAVRASHKEDPYSTDRPFTTRLPAPPTHRNMHMHDKDRNLTNPASARYVNPPWFAFMCSQTPQLMGDLSDVVKINAGKNEIERKDAEEWEQRQFYKQQAVPQHAAGGPQ